MPLQPAYETTLRHGDHAVTLRASLRAAVALDNLPGGIPGAWDSLMRQTYTGIRAVILATATDRAAAFSVLSSLSSKPLASFLGHAQAACLDILMHLLPEPSANARPDPAATVQGCLERLFLFGTVGAQWHPAEVWNTSPRELQRIAVASVPSDHDTPSDVYTAERLREMDQLGHDPAFDRSFDVDTVADAIEALRANFPKFFNAIRRGFYRVVVGKTSRNGLELDEAMLPGFKLGKQDLHIVPIMKGSKRGGIGKIIAGMVLIGLSLATGGALMGTTLFGSTTVGAAVGQIGLGLALTGVASLLAPEQEAPDDAKSFTMTGPQNTTREGGIVPIVYGEVWTGGTMINGSLYLERGDA